MHRREPVDRRALVVLCASLGARYTSIVLGSVTLICFLAFAGLVIHRSMTIGVPAGVILGAVEGFDMMLVTWLSGVVMGVAAGALVGAAIGAVAAAVRQARHSARR
jgi:hypothetical protein